MCSSDARFSQQARYCRGSGSYGIYFHRSWSIATSTFATLSRLALCRYSVGGGEGGRGRGGGGVGEVLGDIGSASTTACEVSKFFLLKRDELESCHQLRFTSESMNTQAQSKALLPKGPSATKSGERFDCDLCCRE